LLPDDTVRTMSDVVNLKPFGKVTPVVQERQVGAVYDSIVKTQSANAAYAVENFLLEPAKMR
jgi:hypothetical protein